MLWVQPLITFLDSDIRPFVLCAFITYKSNLIRTNWESILSNCLDGFRDIDIRRFISVKRLIRNCRDRLAAQLRRDDNVLRRTGVTGNRRFVARYGVFKAVFRVGCLLFVVRVVLHVVRVVLFVVRVVLFVDLCAVRQRCSLFAAHGTIHVAGCLRTRRGAGTRGRLHVGLCLCRQRRCHRAQRHGQRK